MDLEDFAKEKQRLEEDLAGLIAARVSEFEKATGRTPESIDVRTVSIQQIEDRHPKYLIGRVCVSVPI